MAVLTSTLATFAYAQPKVVVLGDDTCPSAEMIRAALPADRPDSAWSGQTLTVKVADDRLALSLGDEPAVRREIPADRDCAVRAESVAVVMAAWSGELASEPTDSPVLNVASPAPVLTPTTPTTQVLELDGGATYSLLWGHAPGAWLGVGRAPRNGGVGARVLGAYQSARNVALEGGDNQVLRVLGGAAATYHLQRRLVFASGDVGLVGTYTRASGTGYETNRTASTANVGGLADLRGGLHWGRLRLWLEARLVCLVHSETVKIQSTSPGVADNAVLSAWDAELGVGLGFRFE
jgi:hypothetical protein